MRGRHILLISFILVVIISSVYLNSTGENVIAIAQNDIEDNRLASLDNVTITTGYFATNLDISFSRYGGSSREEDLSRSVKIYLSLDNVSWIETANYTFMESDRESNVSKSFRFSNSMFESFPFDIEEGETLYISIEYSGRYEWCCYQERLDPLDIEIPLDIIRPWYFTIDWTLFGIFSSIFVSLFTVFLVSRYNKKRIEKELRAKIKNEEL